MSAPEREDRRKKTCSSSGLGLAAAAIGVGVGAALYYFLSKRLEERQSGASGSETFRERPWSLEECSICFEIMLQNQELMSLPCTHRFHAGCIGPWLEAHQICPNCRNPVE